jgi:hypothetical protein
MKEPFVGLIVQLQVGPEFGPDNGMGDREPLIYALRGFLGEWPCTDSGSRSTNIKCWDIPPGRWDESMRFAIGQVEAGGLSQRALIARVDYLMADAGEDYEWGPERVVWPEDKAGPFSLWPEWPGF